MCCQAKCYELRSGTYLYRCHKTQLNECHAHVSLHRHQVWLVVMYGRTSNNPPPHLAYATFTYKDNLKKTFTSFHRLADGGWHVEKQPEALSRVDGALQAHLSCSYTWPPGVNLSKAILHWFAILQFKC